MVQTKLTEEDIIKAWNCLGNMNAPEKRYLNQWEWDFLKKHLKLDDEGMNNQNFILIKSIKLWEFIKRKMSENEHQ